MGMAGSPAFLQDGLSRGRRPSTFCGSTSRLSRTIMTPLAAVLLRLVCKTYVRLAAVRAEVEGGLVRVGRDDVPHEAQPVGEHGTELVRDPIMGHVPDMGADKSFIKKAAKPRAIFFRKLRTAFKRLPDGCWTLPAGFAQGVVDGLVDDNAGGNPWQHLLLALATILPRLVEHRPFEERTGQELLPLLRRSLYPSRDPDAGIVLVGENEPLADFRDLASELAERANAPAAFSGIVAARPPRTFSNSKATLPS